MNLASNHQRSTMHFCVLISLITFFPKAFTNPLPLDSIDSDPYLLTLPDPENVMPPPRDPSISDRLQIPSFSNAQTSQYTPNLDSTEPVAFTDLTAVPCKNDQIGDAFAAGKNLDFCTLEQPTDESGQHTEQPKKNEDPQDPTPAVPLMTPQSDSENSCDEMSVFINHYCCDGNIISPTRFLNLPCYYMIDFCLPCES